MAEVDIKAASRPYVPRGSARDVMLRRDKEMLLSGPAGTGKSRAHLEKLHLCAEKYPGMRGLILRKTRKSLTTTALVTYEDWVLPVGHPAKKGAKREQRSVYYYPNGSVIVVGGLDDPDKIMSSEYDIIYIQEATECLADDIEKCTTRLRNGVLPYQQLLMDCNPATPHHWLKKRTESGPTLYLDTDHRDNPRLFDARTGEWTAMGRDYLSTLDALTGARKDRLRYGKWVAPEGARFPHAIKEIQGFNLRETFRQGVPENYVNWLSIDYGLAAPYCCLWHMMDPEGNIYTYREDYEAGLTADVQAYRVVDLSPENERYYVVFLDPAMFGRFPGHLGKTEKCAADLFTEVLRKHARFGPLERGYNKSREIGFATLDSLLNRENDFPNWFIETGCVNLWRELEDAVFYKAPSGIFTEDLDPTCEDHALTSSVYGLHTHLNPPGRDSKTDEIDYEKIRAARQLKEQQDAEDAALGNTSRLRI